MPRVSTSEESQLVSGSRRSRTILVSFLGAVVRPMGEWMPIAGAVDLMTLAGLDAPSVRTAVFRLKKNGWLEPETRGRARGYVLTDRARSILAAGDEVIWHARQPAELADGWCVVHFSIPESMRSKRLQLRSHVEHLGFGNIGTALWIAPARMRTAAEQTIAELGLTEYAVIFVGDYTGVQDLKSVVHNSWDLGAIDDAYRGFIAEYGDKERRFDRNVPSPADAFLEFLNLVDRWRKLPFRDPGLPTEVLAADWSGPEAVAIFERLVALLEKPALDYAAAHWT